MRSISRAIKLGGVAGAIALVCAVAALRGSSAVAGGGTTTRSDPQGTFLLNGAPFFPLVLSKGPPRDGTTPTGSDALAEVIGAGVNFLKVGPATTPWTDAEISDANLWDQAAAARGAYTWINLSTLSQALPGSAKDTLLQKVITTLKNDPTGGTGIGMWKGADEPWWNGLSPTTLRFTYCRATSRGDPSWCSGEPALDSAHLFVTIEAPRGTSADLAPYTPVTDTHGVDEYPVTFGNANPDLHQVGIWTSTIAAVTPSDSVWTTLQVCSSGSSNGAGSYVLPTRRQERYMIYDAIINGARSLGFYGGNIPDCWSSADAALGWNWTFWYTVLKGLIQEINASSPVAPALVATASNQVLTTSDSTTQAISRSGGLGDLWVFAARSGTGSQQVTISGLPFLGAKTANVYTESRTVTATNGSFTDTFDQWDAHVYHFVSSPTAVSVRGFTARHGARGTVLRWQTGFEAAIAGFDVYRQGRKVNRRLIPAGGAGAGGRRYAWLDRSGRAGVRYRLRTVSLSGRRTWTASALAR